MKTDFEDVVILPTDINFIEYLSEYLVKRFKDDLDKICLVFPGKRPSLFLKKELASKLNTNFFPPVCFSSDEFIEYIVSKKESYSVVSELESIYLLYNLIKSEIPILYRKYSSFMEFLPWGREILTFIEEICLEKINEKNLKNVEELAKIGFDIPKSINEFLIKISKIKNIFYDTLGNKKLATRGLLYFLASEFVDNLDFNEFKKIIFCSPFYLHKTEIEIINKLKKIKDVILFFQTDDNDWEVFKKLNKELGIGISVQKKDFAKPNINFYSAYDMHSEICSVRETLKNLDLNEKTVIVIPKVDIAIPLICEINYLVEDFNLACGYPVKRSLIYSLFKNIFEAQLTRKGKKYYVKNYLKVLKNSLIKRLNLFDCSDEVCSIIIDKVEEILTNSEYNIGGSMFIELKEIEEFEKLHIEILEELKTAEFVVSFLEVKKIIEFLHEKLFHQWEQIDNFRQLSFCLKDALDILVKNKNLEKYTLNLRIVEALYNLQKEIENLSFASEFFNKEEIFKVFLDIVENLKVPILGSPLKGLQILGFYETRNLSFENVLILDVNEGILPNIKLNFPLIPKEIISLLGIDRIKLEEEIQYYHFKRLISSAKNVYLFFVDSEDKERSRWIEKLIWQKQKEENSLKAVNIYEAYLPVNILLEKYAVDKTEEMINYLKDFIFSPTSIDLYIKCPLKFYFRYVLKLKEKEELFEEPESKDIGVFIHKLLQESFKKFLFCKPVIDEKFISEFLKLMKKNFEQELKKRYKTEAFLIEEVMEYFMKKFLYCESVRTKDVNQIICLENNFTQKIKFSNTEFALTTIIDRIDEMNDGSLLVLDYKTGSYERINKKIDIDINNLEREIIKKNVKSFQLFLYYYIIQKNFPEKVVNAGYYDIRAPEIVAIFDENLGERDEKINLFIKCLEFVITEILNPEIKFYLDDTEQDHCKNCSFKYLCS